MSVVLVSGGIDSTVLLNLRKDHIKLALWFDYGQTHHKELEYASIQCSKLGIPLKIIKIKDAIPDEGVALLGGAEITDTKSTVVPNRNMIFLSIAASHASVLGAEKILYGAHHADDPYPDCRPEFVDAMSFVLYKSLDELISVEAPFIEITKGKIVSLAYSHGIDLSETWSCYRGGETHCGTCPACVERKKAFSESGFDDPTEYEK